MLHLGEVAHAPQQTVGNTRRPPGAAGHFQRTLLAHLQPHKARAAPDDMLQIGDLVKLQALHDAEAVAQGRSQRARAGSGANQRKGRQVDFN